MTRRALIVTAAVVTLVPLAALAQQPASPYREQHRTGARGLSRAEIDDLAAGRGMGLARAAELNGYPGPRHVLDADADLGLSAEQRAKVQAVFDGMEREAKRLGARVIADEQALEAAFRGGAITEDELASRVTRIAATQGELRQVHLRAHVATRALLTEAQLARYAELRGYASAPAHQHRH